MSRPRTRPWSLGWLAVTSVLSLIAAGLAVSGSTSRAEATTVQARASSSAAAQLTNIASWGEADQSSTGYGGVAGRAIDGNTNGRYRSGSVAHTRNETNSWWSLELPSPQPVKEIEIWNRTDRCCSDRLSDFWVLTSDKPIPAGSSTQLSANPDVVAVRVTTSPSPSVTITDVAPNTRYVRVQLNGSGYLSLAEVEVRAALPVATQSSTYASDTARFGAQRAVDGITGGNYRVDGITHTSVNDRSPWWNVQLPSGQQVDAITLWNRTDCCAGRLGELTVKVATTGTNACTEPGATEYAIDVRGRRSYRLELEPIGPDTWPVPTAVCVEKDGSILSLAEVEFSAPPLQPFDVTEVDRFDRAWAMAFVPDSELALVTLRTGQLVLRNMTTGSKREVGGVPNVVVAGQGGLGDVAVLPDFATSQQILLSWVEAGPGDTRGAVVGRAKLNTDAAPRLENVEVLWRQDPTTGFGHYAHRLAVTPDGGSVFITSGDRQEMNPAQDPNSNLGKIIRLDLGTGAATTWTMGHRNPLGIEFAPDGQLWSSEMGPAGGDELNRIEQGGNYGWPNVSNGSHYDGAPIPDHRSGDGYVAPSTWWTPSISPGSLMIYDGEAFPEWRGDAFLGALSGKALVRVDLDGTTAEPVRTWPMPRRIRVVEQDPRTGAIWLIEDGVNGALLRLTPAQR